MKKYYIIGAMLLLLTVGCGNKKSSNEVVNKKEEVKEVTDNYVAYIKINPSIKLEYSQKCNEIDGKKQDCEDPIVNTITPINDDAKEIFKDVDLLSEDKNLKNVLNKIYTKVEEKGIKVDKVEIESNWDNMNDYLSKESSTEETKSTTKYNVTVNKVEKETIETTITSDEETEKKQKEEAAKKAAELKAKQEAEAKAKAEAEKKAKEEAAKKAAEEKTKKEAAAKKAAAEKAAITIKLSDNVTFCHSMQTFSCKNCFNNTLINQLKSAKGHSVVKSSASEITIKVITSLSGKYNSSKFFGTSLISKIKSAGGEEIGGAGGCEDKVTKAICNEYHLTCQ